MLQKTKRLTLKKLAEEIQTWKEKRKAVILAHVYQPGEIQDIADFIGDSLYLSQQAVQTKAEVILFCGVQFMAETAAILSPKKIVLLPEMHASCSMANMATAKEVKKKIKEMPQVMVISYVNSFAAVKALSDYCCTSANVVEVARAVSLDQEILFIPDMNLGQFTATRSRRKITRWRGYCAYHNNLSKKTVLKRKQERPQALLLVHPECAPEVCALADYIGSTKGILDFVKSSKAREFIIATEIGILYPLQKAHPEKCFYPASEKMVCPDMKLITLEKVLASLKTLTPPVEVTKRNPQKGLDSLGEKVRDIEITLERKKDVTTLSAQF
jgi:quinolinate synthase